MPATERDVIYHSPGGVALQARLYVPEGKGPFPGVIGVHGGRWCAEDRFTNAVIDRALAESGCLVMALDFRMPPAVKYPLPVADINFAIRWLRANAQDLSVDPTCIGAVGTSSGGHQILLNALRPDDPAYRRDHDKAVDAVRADLAFVVACWPVSDPRARYAYARERAMDLHVRSHEAYWADEAEMDAGSPMRIVQDGKADRLPPLLLIQGSADVVLSPKMSERFADAYRAAGGPVELRTYADQPHTFITKDPEGASSKQALADICAFVSKEIARSWHDRET
ncbi:MAG: alpha/beta hydrolase [Hyphomicrobiales bacterium]|jgi:acetyl esterase|nr:alpha/beta hydrolase [Hyphomicrobiales bacterium]